MNVQQAAAPVDWQERRMYELQSVAAILDGLRAGDDRVAESVFRRFSHRLIALAGSRLDETL